jgi:uncharacterized SAM-binding protein YcdF (DUF218 family)
MYPFLALCQPVDGQLLALEGWVPDAIMEQTATRFQTHHYQRVVVTGCPLERARYLVGYETYAEVGADTLKKLGLSEAAVVAVPCPKVRVNRTYESARALRKWLDHNAPNVKSIDVVTHGPHARRTRLLYQKALGDHVAVGILALADTEYGPENWWRMSKGFRDVLGEAIAWVYARFLFVPPREGV